MNTPTYNEAKLKELVLYILHRCEGDQALWPVKLNKLLFFSDFLAYSITGDAITGAEYIKLPYGPAPKFMGAIHEAMQKDGDLEIFRQSSLGFLTGRAFARREPNLFDFTGYEIALVNDILSAFTNTSATDISEMSHLLIGWQVAGDKETIPYVSIFVSGLKPSNDDAEWVKGLAKRHKW